MCSIHVGFDRNLFFHLPAFAFRVRSIDIFLPRLACVVTDHICDGFVSHGSAGFFTTFCPFKVVNIIIWFPSFFSSYFHFDWWTSRFWFILDFFFKLIICYSDSSTSGSTQWPLSTLVWRPVQIQQDRYWNICFELKPFGCTCQPLFIFRVHFTALAHSSRRVSLKTSLITPYDSACERFWIRSHSVRSHSVFWNHFNFFFFIIICVLHCVSGAKDNALVHRTTHRRRNQHQLKINSTRKRQKSELLFGRPGHKSAASLKSSSSHRLVHRPAYLAHTVNVLFDESVRSISFERIVNTHALSDILSCPELVFFQSCDFEFQFFFKHFFISLAFSLRSIAAESQANSQNDCAHIVSVMITLHAHPTSKTNESNWFLWFFFVSSLLEFVSISLKKCLQSILFAVQLIIAVYKFN